jgi:glutamate synthase domain-containing protein 3
VHQPTVAVIVTRERGMLDQAKSKEREPVSGLEIDSSGLHYKELNARLRKAVASGVERITLHNVCGQRYLGTDLHAPVEIRIEGTPGNGLASFMDGPRLVVHGNAQDGCGNTMNGGEVVVHGRAGDVTGYSMRGGRIFVRDGVGYRVGIHMKEYQGQRPVIVIGGTAQHFLGEYMAGGVLVVLGLTLLPGERHISEFVGTGMHGGAIYVRGQLEEYQLGREVGQVALDSRDEALLDGLVGEYCGHFSCRARDVFSQPFTKLMPLSSRPYGQLYAY